MKTASISEIRKETAQRSSEDVTALLLRLARHSKENKELLTYLLFEADFEENYIGKVQEEIKNTLDELKGKPLRHVKKGLQKLVKLLKKYIRFSGRSQTEIEILLYFCGQLNSSGISFRKHQVLLNLYDRQRAAIGKAVASLNEDLQYDYREEIENLG